MATKKYDLERVNIKGVTHYKAFLVSDPSITYGPVQSRLAALAGIARKVGATKKSRTKKVSRPANTVGSLVAGLRRKLFVTMCIDRSGSMQDIMAEANVSLKEQLLALQKSSKDNNVDTQVRVLAFDERMDWIVGSSSDFFDLSSLDVMNVRFIDARGGTSLLDAVGLALETSPENESSLIMTITDGHENCSTRYNQRSLANIVAARVAADKTTLTFLGPKGSANAMVHLGFSAGNCQEWEQTSAGVKNVTRLNTAGLGTYTKSIASGATSSDSFYVDAGNLKTNTVKKNLSDLSSRFRALRVDREEEIAKFVARKLGMPYRKGMAYYQLSKSEKSVQSYKNILVRKKNENKIYGGIDARNVLGIPEGKDIKLKIANLGEWDVFVQSTSLNRLLVRGTDLLVES